MADETRYSNEFRIPISITLPWSGKLTREGKPWPVDKKGRDWPSHRGRPVFPIDQLPHGFAPGTNDIYRPVPPEDRKTVPEQFAAIDDAMWAELRRVRRAMGEAPVRRVADGDATSPPGATSNSLSPEALDHAIYPALAGQSAEVDIGSDNDGGSNRPPSRQSLPIVQTDTTAGQVVNPSEQLPFSSSYQVAATGGVASPKPTPLPLGYQPAPDDINLLARTLFSEGSNTPSAYTALGWAIVNRINSDVYGASDTLAGVISYPNQFQGVGTTTFSGNLPWRLSANPSQLTGANLDSWNQAVTAATQILTGNSVDPTGGATSFYSNSPGLLAASINSGKLIPTFQQGVWHFLVPSR